MYEWSKLQYTEYGHDTDPKLSVTINRSDHMNVVYTVNFTVDEDEIIFSNLNVEGSDVIVGEFTKFECGAVREAVEYIQWHEQYQSYDIVTPFDMETIRRYMENV